jgi:hypothetical protein
MWFLSISTKSRNKRTVSVLFCLYEHGKNFSLATAALFLTLDLTIILGYLPRIT